MKINLGKKLDLCSPCCSPGKSDEDEKTYYPSLYIEGDAAKELKKLPEDGVLKVRYKRAGLTISDREGEQHCTVDLEIREILGARGLEEVKKTAEQALDDLAKEISDY